MFGLAPPDARAAWRSARRTAFVSDEKDLYDYMTVGEMIAFTRSFYPRWRAELEQQYLRKFELPPGREIKGLSRGTRTKLALLLALCRGAELLILDEPTSGLDPAMAEDVLQALVGHVAARESTVFFSSHQLSEVEQIADHVAIIDRGQTVVAGALDDLRAQYQRIQLVFDGDAPEFRIHAPGTHRVQPRGPRAHHPVLERRRGGARRAARLSAGVDRRVAGHAEGHFSRVGRAAEAQKRERN